MAGNIKRNGKREKETKKQNKAVPYILGGTALFLILTIFLSETGYLGKGLKNFLLGLFGAGYYYLPFVMLWLAIKWRKSAESDSLTSKIVLCVLNFISLLVIFNVFSAEDPKLFGFSLYAKGQELNGAGLLGGTVGAVFCYIIDKIATIIFSILTFTVSLIFILGSTPRATVRTAVTFFKGLKFAESDDESDYEKEKRFFRKKPVPLLEEKNDKKLFTLPEESPERDEEIFSPVMPDIIIPETEIRDRQPLIPEDEEIFRSESVVLDGKREKPAYIFPPISCLSEKEDNSLGVTQAELNRTGQRLVEILNTFKVATRLLNTSYGPTVTRYELQPETGVKVKSISLLADDIALHLAATSVRIESIPGKAAIGIEIPNKTAVTVKLRELLENTVYNESRNKLLIALGVDVAGNPIYLDIAKMPHLLIAGATGMGKSVCLNSLIISLLYRAAPDDVKLILIDPKRVEMNDYNGIPHLLVPVISDPKKAAGTLNWACVEMEKRYSMIEEVGARNLAEYNSTVADDPEREQVPSIVIVIDELADLMMTAPDDVETSICRLAQKARAAGMYLVIGTQRPSVDVITGLIKANIPSRIAFTVASQIDSRTIIDMAGAEKLMGRGDMLYMPVGALKPLRVQGAFVDGKTEVTAIAQFIKEAAQAEYNQEVMDMIEQEAKMCGIKASKRVQPDDEDDKDDPMMIQALQVAFDCGNISTTMLQSTLSIGYARASRIITKLEARGFIGEFDTSQKKRPLLISKEAFLEMKLNREQ